jgi:hypothetical protein
MRSTMLMTLCILSACSIRQPTSDQRHLKIAEQGGPYIADVTRYESLGQKSLNRGQKYRISNTSEDRSPFYLVADVTQIVGGKKGDVSQGALIYIEDGVADYDCHKWLTDRKLSEADEDTPVISCNFKFVGTIPVEQGAVVEKSE